MKKEINWLLKEKYHGVLTKAAKKDIGRLEKGEPLDYVIGFTDFLGCKIDVSCRPLIPRPETEFWVQKAMDELKVVKLSSYKVLDMFAGSGCIGISIMRHIKNSYVVFVEKDKKLIEQIRINCKLNHIDNKRYQVTHSDIFENVKGKFDYIFANPPYIPTARKHKIQASVLTYEPSRALFGGSDGLRYIRKFLASAKNFLNDNGTLYMEFDSIQKKKIEALLKKYHYKKWEFCKDQYGKWRYVVV